MVAHVHEITEEPMRTDAGQQRLQRSACGVHCARRIQCVTHQQQVVAQLVRVRVRGRQLHGAPRVARRRAHPGRLQPSRHEGELQAHRLVGIAPAVGFPQLGEEQPVALEARMQRRIEFSEPRRDGDPLDQHVHRVVVPAHDGVARAACRGNGDLGRHERIAVAVPADPVAEPKWHHALHGLGRDAELVLPCADQDVPRTGAGVEQACLQIPEHRADFVSHGWPVVADLVGAPQQLHLAVERFLDRAPLRLGCSLPQQQAVGHARLQGEQGATRGLGRVRREYGPHVELQHRLLHFGGRPAVAMETLHGPARRCRLRLGVVHEPVGAGAAHPVHLLRGVDEEEKQGERTRRDGAQLDRQRIDPAQQLRQPRRTGLAMTARTARLAQRLDRLVRHLPLDAADDAAKRRGEPAHVVVQRLVHDSDRGGRDMRGGGQANDSGAGQGMMHPPASICIRLP